VDGRTLIRLRFAFVALGLALLVPLALLLRSAAGRLEEQRRLKHEVVAERIFDEMERELVALVEHERERPSGAYAATNTSARSWAPFVVGYFTYDAGGPKITARTQLTAERATLVSSAANRSWQSWVGARQERVSKQDAPAAEPAAVHGLTSERPPAVGSPKQEAVLRKLNRAQLKRAPGSSSNSGADSLLNPYRDDPLGASQ